MFVNEDENELVKQVKSNTKSKKVEATVVSEEKEFVKNKYNTVELPSMGRLGYDAEISYRDIMVRDEKVLSSATQKSYNKILGKVLKSLLADDTIYDKLSINDRDFLLTWIWANSYSTIKHFDFVCEHCGNEEEISIDISTLPVKNIEDTYPLEGFKFKSSGGLDLTLRLVTIADERIAEEYAQKHKTIEYSDVVYALTTDVGTIMPLAEKLIFIDDNISGKDMAIIRAFHKHYKYGLAEDYTQVCSNCGESVKSVIPFSLDHFMPTLQSDFEKLLQVG